MGDNNSASPSGFQIFSTLLAFLLPVLQFFFNFLPSQSRGLFLAGHSFLTLSVIAAVFSYILIIAFKSTLWFEVPINYFKHMRYRSFLRRTDQNIFSFDEVQQYRRENQVDKPFYLTPANLYLLTIPMLLAFLVIFLWIGIYYPSSTINTLQLWQSVDYILLVAVATLTLAAFYINASNRSRFDSIQQRKFGKILELAYKNRAFAELPNILFIAQMNFQAITQFDLLTIAKVNETYYKIVSDSDAKVLHFVEPYPTLEDLVTSIQQAQRQ